MTPHEQAVVVAHARYSAARRRVAEVAVELARANDEHTSAKAAIDVLASKEPT